MTHAVWGDFDLAHIEGAKRECGMCKHARKVPGGGVRSGLMSVSAPGLTESTRIWGVRSVGWAGPAGEQCVIAVHTKAWVVMIDKRYATVVAGVLAPGYNQ